MRKVIDPIVKETVLLVNSMHIGHLGEEGLQSQVNHCIERVLSLF